MTTVRALSIADFECLGDVRIWDGGVDSKGVGGIMVQ